MPDDLVALIPMYPDPFAKPDDPTMAARLAADPFQIIDGRIEPMRQLLALFPLSQKCLTLLHAKLRRCSDDKIEIATILFAYPQYRDEMRDVLQQELRRSGIDRLTQLVYAGLTATLDREFLAPYLEHPDARIRIAAARLLKP